MSIFTQISAFAFDVLSKILIFYHYFRNSEILYNIQDDNINKYILLHLHTLYTPNNIGKYLSLTYYRVCWHVN